MPMQCKVQLQTLPETPVTNRQCTNTSYSTLCSYCTRSIHIHPCTHIDKKPIVFFEDAHIQYQDMCMMSPWLSTACTTIWHLHCSPWDSPNMEPSNWMNNDSWNQCTLSCWYWHSIKLRFLDFCPSQLIIPRVLCEKLLPNPQYSALIAKELGIHL